MLHALHFLYSALAWQTVDRIYLPGQLFDQINDHINPRLDIISTRTFNALVNIYTAEDRRADHPLVGPDGNVVVTVFFYIFFA